VSGSGCAGRGLVGQVSANAALAQLGLEQARAARAKRLALFEPVAGKRGIVNQPGAA
jgi:hypothetical protein